MSPASLSPGETYHDPAGCCHWAGRPHLGPCVDRSREAGRALSTVRAVLSWAQTARQELVEFSTTGPHNPLERPRLPKPATPPGCVDVGAPPCDPTGQPFDDPDHAVMVDVLGQVIDALSPWRRGPGKTQRWVSDDGPAQLVVDGPSELYAAEVGDEMFTGHLAVLAELRKRLARHFMLAPNAQRTMLGVMDGYVRELVAEWDEDEEDE